MASKKTDDEIFEEALRHNPAFRERLEKLERGESGAGIPIDWLLDPSPEVQKIIEEALSRKRPPGDHDITEEIRQKIEELKRRNAS